MSSAHIQNIYPLTPMQDGMLYHAVMHPESDAYFLQNVMTVEGELDISALELTMNRLLERFDVFRTVFMHKETERALQVVLKKREAKVIYHDLTALCTEELEACLERITEQDKLTPFQLDKDVLMRITVVRFADKQYKMIWSIPHIVIDGWSLGIVSDAFYRIYRSVAAGEAAMLPPAPSFGSYLTWLRRQDQAKAMDYWKKYLEGYGQQIELPGKSGSNKKAPYQLESIRIEIDRDISDRLERLCRQHKVTMGTVAQTVWGILLQRYNNIDDVVFGSVISGRPPEVMDVEEMVGLFVNTVPLRVRKRSGQTFAELIADVQQSMIDANRYGYVSLADIQTAAAQPSLIGHLFAFENYPIRDEEPVSSLDQGGTSFTIRQTEVFEHTNYDFHLTAAQSDYLVFEINYNAAVYHDDGMRRMEGHLRTIVGQISESWDMSIESIDLMTDVEKRQIIIDFNQTESPYPKEKTVTELLEEQANLHPDNIAVVYKDSQLTYAKLVQRSSRLAGLLSSRGVRRGSIVGLMAEQSIERIVGIFAILKAGGAYMTIDPELPKQRKLYMLEDAGAECLLTYGRNTELAEFGGDRIRLESWSDYEWAEDEQSSMGQTPGDLANIMYTSGSTGAPKGVMIEHRNIVRLVKNASTVPLHEEVRLLQTGAFGFDAITFEIFGVLLNGGRLHLIDKDVLLDAGLLATTLRQYSINTMFLTTQLFNQLAIEDPVILSGIDYLIVGGEALAPKPIQIVRAACPQLTIINAYGPTENTVFSTYHWVDRDYAGNIPIGRPVSNSSVYIVSRDGQLQPIGVPGELCVGGDGVGRGYVNKPEATAERFIDNPFAPGTRLYRTGDLAQWHADGTMEYLGRMDDQVKIRGFRIEISEIEFRLSKYSCVKEAIVTAIGDKDMKYLCAYVVLADGEHVEEAELSRDLAEELPDYMIPSHFVLLDRLPLTPNGKVDRKALPQPVREEGRKAVYVAPNNETERQMVELWESVLGTSPIGTTDNFFSLGGHSLKAMSLVSRINRALNRQVSIRMLLENPTIQDLCGVLDKEGAQDKQVIVPMKRTDACDYPLTHAQQRIYLISQFDSVGVAYHIPYVLRINGNLNKRHVEQVLQALVERHESLRVSFHVVDGKLVQRRNDPIQFQLEMLGGTSSWADQFELDTVLNAFVRPFDLSCAPLFRAGLASVSENEHYLALDMHHIIVDGVSVNVLMEELVLLYKEQELPPLQLDYLDYAIWQNEPRQRERLEQQKQYWLQTFAGELPVLQLPTDYPRPHYHSYKGSSVSATLEPDLSHRLRQLAEGTGTTMYMICIAAYSALLHRHTGQEDVIVGSPVAGRIADGLERSVGMFVNTLAMRHFPIGSKSFREFLSEVKTCTLGALDNEQYPLEELLEQLQLPRQANRNPLFDTMFVFQNGVDGGSSTDETGIEVVDYEMDIAKFDLTFTIVDNGDTFHLSVEFSKDLYHRDTAERMARHYINVLRHISENTDVSLEAIELLDKAEQQILLQTFNDTQREYPRDRTIAELFDEQALRNPDRPAVVYDGQSLTYRELQEHAGKLAVVLQKRGVRADSVVGIYADKSLELIVGIMAVLRAGGAFLTLDKSLPSDRIRYMLEDSGARIVLTDGAGGYDFADPGIEAVNISVDRGDEQELPHGQELSYASVATDLAYIMYTSGSTGQPKGVMVEQRNVVRLVKNTNYVPLNENVRILQTGAIGFDAITFEIFGALLNGGCLYLVDKTVILDAEALSGVIARNGINMMWLTSSLFNQLVQAKPSTFTGISYLIVGGEALSPKHIQSAREACPELLIVNGYGPTENTTFSTSFPVMHNYDSNIPIGRPIANSTAYIVSKSGMLQPIGVHGELCVGGDGVGRGYVNKEDETALKFVENPFAPGMKMYRTGDLARWLPDGTIEYSGRIDQQVKIRGYRIETGEIEQRLGKHHSVKEAIVVVGGKDHGKYLCAYVVPNNDQSVDKAGLLRYLVAELPDYMIPSQIVILEQLPLTANGKVDKRSLPEPEAMERSGSHYAAPTNQIEILIAREWERVLDVKPIGIYDNFFAIGGQSLKAMELVAALQRAGLRANISHLFEEQTIAGMAGRLLGGANLAVEQQRSEQVSNLELIAESAAEYSEQIDDDNEEWLMIRNDIVDQLSKDHKKYCQRVMEGDVIGVHPLSPSQQFHLHHPECSGTMIRLDFDVNISALKQALLAIVQTQRLMRSVLRAGTEKTAWVEYEVPSEIDLSIINILEYNKSIKRKIWNEVLRDYFYEEHQFDRLLYRMALIKESEESFTLLLPFSHIIFDYMSGEIIRRDLIEHYLFYAGEAEKPAVRMSDYWQYHRQISKGPVGLGDDQLFQGYELEELNAASSAVASLVRDKDRASGTSLLVNIPLAGSLQLNSEMRWSFAMTLISRYLCSHFELDNVPIWLTRFGRSYEQEHYYDTVGEFIDHIPFNLRRAETIMEASSRLLPRLQEVSQYNLHFMNLIYNDDMHQRYPRSSAYLQSSFTQLPIVINYLGQLSEDHNELEHLEREAVINPEPDMLLFSVRNTERELLLSVYLPYREDEGEIRRQIEQFVPAMLDELTLMSVQGSGVSS